MSQSQRVRITLWVGALLLALFPAVSFAGEAKRLGEYEWVGVSRIVAWRPVH